MRLPMKDTHLAALRAVSERKVTWHDGCGVHVIGYAWSCGSDMPEFLQEACADLKHALLVHVGATEFCGNPVVMTADGDKRLREWTQRTLGRAA